MPLEREAKKDIEMELRTVAVVVIVALLCAVAPPFVKALFAPPLEATAAGSLD